MVHLNIKAPFPDNKHRLFRLGTDENAVARHKTGTHLSEIVKPLYKSMKSLLGQHFPWEPPREYVSPKLNTGTASI